MVVMFIGAFLKLNKMSSIVNEMSVIHHLFFKKMTIFKHIHLESFVSIKLLGEILGNKFQNNFKI